MGWRCEWRVVCDQCGQPARHRDRLSDNAERKATKAGWLAWEGFYGRFHACPECRGRLDHHLAASLADSNETKGANQ